MDMFKHLKKDIPASLVVFLVAVPLSMGIALASGAPIMAGLVSAAIGGIIVGALSGAPLQVSGPAAGLAVIAFGFIQQFGFAGFCALTAVAGGLQILFGILKVARVALAISPAVIHGMLAGIGIQIALAQLHVILGGTPESSAIRNVRELPGQIADLHGGATLFGFVTIALLLLWPLIPVKALKKHVPAALVAVVLATAASVWAGTDMPRVELPHWRGAFHWPVMPAGSLGAILGAIITLAIVASAESLLSATATDKLHGGKSANLDRELIAQGVGNLTAGMVGGLPITGVIVRSTANISAGGKTRMSAMLHGVWVVVFVTQLGFLIHKIPLSVLAGLLVVVGVRLVNLAHIRDLIKHKEATIYFVTVAGVVGINLLAGIGIGVGLALIQLIRRLTRVRLTMEMRDKRVHVLITGSLTFLGVPKLSAFLAELPPKSHVDVDLNVDVLDHAAFEALHGWRITYERGGGTVDMDQLHEAWTPDAPAAPAPEPVAAPGMPDVRAN
jgi:carbonic anhydrase